MKITYRPKGVCSQLMDIEVEDGKIESVKVTGGCSGNLQGISSLVKGMKAADAIERMRAIPHLHLLGSDQAEEHNGILTFVIDGVHPHDVGEILAADGVCVRAGHHCAQPLLQHLGHTSTVRASYSFYNTPADTDRLIESLSAVRERMGYGK